MAKSKIVIKNRFQKLSRGMSIHFASLFRKSGSIAQFARNLRQNEMQVERQRTAFQKSLQPFENAGPHGCYGRWI
jgi:hypothetical protein